MLSRRIAILVLMILSFTAMTAQAQQNVVNAKGFLSLNSLPIGSDFKLAVQLDIQKGFHTNTVTPKLGQQAKLDIKPMADMSFGKPNYPKETMKSFAFSPEPIPVYEGKVFIFVDGKISGNARLGKRNIVARFSYQPCSDSMCFAPTSAVVSIPVEIVPKGTTAAGINADVFKTSAGPTSAGNQSNTAPNDAASAFGKGMLIGLLVVFGTGFLLSLTPCVYPMIPVTVGYFGMQTERRTGKVAFLAILYVLGLALSYSVLGTFAALTGRMFGTALQNPYIPLIIAAVLVLLALSMFGVYEFKVPSFISSRSHGKQGAVGALLMGALFGVVCAPCVGPFTIGLLLYIAQVGKPLFGFLSFFVLALGLGTPFFFLAIFSGSLNKLPKAGMWMISVRRVFGLLLLGAAIYYVTPLIGRFISVRVADNALPSFITLSGIYIGWLDSSFGTEQRAKRVRQFAGLVIALVGLVAIMGSAKQLPKMTFQPYTEAAVAQASTQGKPVMIDFSADWCAVCKEIDHNTFTATSVKSEGDRFVRLRADQTVSDSTEVKARQHKFSIAGLPTIIFLDSNGNEVKSARVTGDITPTELVKKMSLVR